MRAKIIFFILLISMDSPVFPQHYWQLMDSGSIQNLNDVDFISIETGVAVGDASTILCTQNGGISWIPVALGISADLQGVSFASEARVLAVGTMGTVLLSEDQGESWQQISGAGVSYDLLDISFDKTSGRGVITGQTNAIIVTDNFGETWTVVHDGYMSTFYSASMVNENMGIVVGWNSIFQPLLGYTTDWQTWDYSNFYPTWGGVMYEGLAHAGKFTDETHGFIVGTYFVPGGGFLAPFGGWSNNSWDAQSFPQPLMGIDLKDSFGVVTGSNAYLAESQDSGVTWEAINLNIGSCQLNEVKLIGNTGFIVGDGGIILKMISTVSVDENEINNSGVQCFPNPATKELHIGTPFKNEPFTVSIFDINGSEEINFIIPSGNESVNISVEWLSRGIYSLIIESKQRKFCSKLVLI
jgi:photosystem II stability/assembly factor-like uncharacterized protein